MISPCAHWLISNRRFIVDDVDVLHSFEFIFGLLLLVMTCAMVFNEQSNHNHTKHPNFRNHLRAIAGLFGVRAFFFYSLGLFDSLKTNCNLITRLLQCICWIYSWCSYCRFELRCALVDSHTLWIVHNIRHVHVQITGIIWSSEMHSNERASQSFNCKSKRIEE